MFSSGCDDDGEFHAGSRMLHLLNVRMCQFSQSTPHPTHAAATPTHLLPAPAPVDAASPALAAATTPPVVVLVASSSSSSSRRRRRRRRHDVVVVTTSSSSRRRRRRRRNGVVVGVDNGHT